MPTRRRNHFLISVALLIASWLSPISSHAAGSNAGAGSASTPVVVALKSDGLEVYDQALVGFGGQVGVVEIVPFDLGGDAKRADSVMEQARAKKPALVLALGPLAANAAKRAFTDVPVLFCMVPNYEKYGLDAHNVTGIALTRSLDEQLGSIKALLPEGKKIGVLYTPEYSQELVSQASKVAEGMGLKLVAEKLGKDRDVGEASTSLASKVDALWMIADRGAATLAASQALIRAAKNAHVPLFALSEGQVREGALLAFSATPQAMGAQAGKLASRIVFEKVNPGALQVASPSGLEAWLNDGTLHALSLDATFATRLLDHAAQKNLSVRVVP